MLDNKYVDRCFTFTKKKILRYQKLWIKILHKYKSISIFQKLHNRWNRSGYWRRGQMVNYIRAWMILNQKKCWPTSAERTDKWIVLRVLITGGGLAGLAARHELILHTWLMDQTRTPPPCTHCTLHSVHWALWSSQRTFAKILQLRRRPLLN